ncbi:hypothetical protein D3C78_1707790 [compost metagenome]
MPQRLTDYCDIRPIFISDCRFRFPHAVSGQLQPQLVPRVANLLMQFGTAYRLSYASLTVQLENVHM